jgi:hypothetical protein
MVLQSIKTSAMLSSIHELLVWYVVVSEDGGYKLFDI